MNSKQSLLSCVSYLDFEPKTPSGKGGNLWWLILRTDEEIIKYYQWWIEREYQIKLQRPLFGAHISVMRGEEPSSNHELWKVRQDEELVIDYNVEIQSGEGFWWLPVRCPEMACLRVNFGLPPEPEHPFHMTIGRVMP